MAIKKISPIVAKYNQMRKNPLTVAATKKGGRGDDRTGKMTGAPALKKVIKKKK